MPEPDPNISKIVAKNSVFVGAYFSPPGEDCPDEGLVLMTAPRSGDLADNLVQYYTMEDAVNMAGTILIEICRSRMFNLETFVESVTRHIIEEQTDGDDALPEG